MRIRTLLCISTLVGAGAGSLTSPTPPVALGTIGPSAQASRDLVDLRRIGHIGPVGRVQDQYLPVVEALIKAGPPAVPFLISKLEDRTRLPGYGSVLDFWPSVEVRHVALLVLTDFFTRPDGKTATVSGFTWDDILDRRSPDPPAWSIYAAFEEKNGRAAVRRKIDQLLAPHKGRLEWNAAERCFRRGSSGVRP